MAAVVEADAAHHNNNAMLSRAVALPTGHTSRRRLVIVVVVYVYVSGRWTGDGFSVLAL